ncbi:hypothetical protein ACVWYQ_007673 [Bradyrhizobium sp. USDA 3397]
MKVGPAAGFYVLVQVRRANLHAKMESEGTTG